MGNTRFTEERDIRIQKMRDAGLSRPFPALNYRPKTARLYQTPDGKWRISISCEEPDPEPYAGEPDCGPDPGHLERPPVLARVTRRRHPAPLDMMPGGYPPGDGVD